MPSSDAVYDAVEDSTICPGNHKESFIDVCKTRRGAELSKEIGDVPLLATLTIPN